MKTDNPVRRTIEATVAAILLLLSLPAVALAAGLSLAAYRAWPFFVQDRVGLGGRTFRILKVRTLPPATDPYADKYSIGEGSIPAVMRQLRRLHLDELPQLLHIVTGQMTFVGPRPEMPNLHAALPSRFASERVSVRPGLTGLWQISPHCHQLIGQRPEYDLLYLQHRTASFDLWLLWRTVVKLATGQTTHLFEVPRRAIMPVPAPHLRFEIADATMASVLDLRDQASHDLPARAMAGAAQMRLAD